jgi:hypothetical protein
MILDKNDLTRVIAGGEKNLILSQSEIIENVLEQEAAGVVPRFSWYDEKTRGAGSPAGWLVWSTWDRGCGVVYRRNDGAFVLLTGWQGDFCLS